MYGFYFSSSLLGSPIPTPSSTPLLQARGGIEQDVLEAYCWMYSTWNIPKEYKGACSGGDQVLTTSEGQDMGPSDKILDEVAPLVLDPSATTR